MHWAYAAIITDVLQLEKWRWMHHRVVFKDMYGIYKAITLADSMQGALDISWNALHSQ